MVADTDTDVNIINEHSRQLKSINSLSMFSRVTFKENMYIHTHSYLTLHAN